MDSAIHHFSDIAYHHVCSHQGYCLETCLLDRLALEQSCLTVLVKLFQYHYDRQLNASGE